MKHLWSIICNRLIVDEETKNTSLIDTLEEIKIQKDFLKDESEIPLFFNFVSLWLIEKKDIGKEKNILIEFYDPENNKLNDFKFILNPPKNQKRVRTNIRFNKFLLNGSGIYKMKILQEGLEVGEILLEVNIK